MEDWRNQDDTLQAICFIPDGQQYRSFVTTRAFELTRWRGGRCRVSLV
jgi:hypothetical protein